MDLSNVPLSKNISSRFRSYIYHVPRNLASLSEWALPLPILDCLSILVLVHARSPNINKHLFSQSPFSFSVFGSTAGIYAASNGSWVGVVLRCVSAFLWWVGLVLA